MATVIANGSNNLADESFFSAKSSLGADQELQDDDDIDEEKLMPMQSKPNEAVLESASTPVNSFGPPKPR